MAEILVRPWQRGKWIAMPGTKRLCARSAPRGQTAGFVLFNFMITIFSQELLRQLWGA